MDKERERGRGVNENNRESIDFYYEGLQKQK